MKRKAIIPALVLSVSLVGCGTESAKGNPGVGSQTSPPIGPVATITSVDQIVRPVDRYLVTPQQVTTIQSAANMLNEKCMKEFGLRGVATELFGFDAKSIRYDKTHAPLYGFFDPAQAGASGYDRVPSQPAPAPSGAVPPSMDAMTVEHGMDAAGNPVSTFAGKSLPAGGCKGQSVRGTGGALPIPDPKALPDHGPQIPTDDPRILKVTAAWSACMKTKGFTYSNPQDALDNPQLIPKTSERNGVISVQHSADELKQASADVACKLSTNMVGISLAVQSAYDTRYVEGHTQALREYSQQIEGRVREAAQISKEEAKG